MKNYASNSHGRQGKTRQAARWFGALLSTIFVVAWSAPRASAAEVALSWADNSNNENGFKVERATGTAAFAEIATVAADVVAYVDTAVTGGTTYNYRVRAYNAVGDSPLSNTVAAVIPVAANVAPTISAIADRSIAQGAGTGAIAFTIGDAESATSALALSIGSSNLTLVPVGNITFGGNGANRTVSVTPAAAITGTATITITVSDGALSASETFVLTVSAVTPANTAPTLSAIADRSIAQGAGTGALAFTIGDAESAASALALSSGSSNLTLVPVGNITFGGNGANRTVSVTPAAGINGTATITITVSDGTLSASDAFVLTVNAVAPANTAPTLSNVSDQAVAAGGNTGALAFSIGDAESAASELVVTAGSSNTALVSLSGIALSGTGASRSVTVTPAAGQSGSATITLTVSDGELSANDTFIVTLAGASNTAPTINNIFSRTITEDATTGAVSFTIADTETTAANLIVSGSSSNTALVPIENISFAGSGGTRTVTVTPLPNRNGFSTITVTVTDGELTDTDAFRVTVSAVNDAPTITDIGNQVVDFGVPTAALGFTVNDVETAAGSLNLSATSSNPVLVPAGNLVLGGSGTNRTIVVTPATGQSGTATITLAVSDGSASSSDSFTVTVNVGSADTPPAVSSVTNQTSSPGGQVGPVAFTVADTETAAASLIVTGSSSNQSLVPNSNIVIGGSGASRTVTVLAASGQSGTATITLTVSDGVNSTTETFVVAFDTPLSSAARMLNLSSRVVYRPGAEMLIPGFVISGTENKRVLLRVVGPTLGAEPFNVPGVLANPRMTLKRWDGAAFVDHAANDDWGTNANVSEIRQVTDDVSAFPLTEGGGDAVLLLDLSPGRYTVVADDANGATGLVIVEIYDADADGTGSSIVNMSNRGYVGVGGDVMITGFVVSQEAPKTLLIRAVGPGLAVAPYNVPNTIADPIIDIYRRNLDGTDTLVLTHDNWSDGPDAAETALIAEQVFAFALPIGSLDAAVVATMDPGVYTVVVRGVGDATGTALVEVYTVE